MFNLKKFIADDNIKKHLMDCIKNCMQIALNSSVQIKNTKDGTLVSFADIDIDLAIKKIIFIIS